MADLTIMQGEGKTIPLTYTDEDGNAVDLTSATLSWVMKKSYSAAAVISKANADFTDRTEEADGIVKFTVTETQTNITPGAYLAQAKAYWTATNSDLSLLMVVEVQPALIAPTA